MRSSPRSVSIMWPPSIPMSTAILPCAWARRTPSAEVTSTRACGCRRTCSRTASIRSSARLTPFGPLTSLGVQMDRNTAFKPPSRIRRMSRWPWVSRWTGSKFSNSSRCGVSACVSSTIELKCSLRARSASSSAGAPEVSTLALSTTAADTSQARSRAIGSSNQPAQQPLLDGLPVDFGNGLGQRNLFRANLYTVLRVGAIGHAARAHDRLEAFARVHRPGGMHVEQAHLADDGSADEGIVLVHLGTHFEASAAGDAARQRVSLLLEVGRHPRPAAQVVGAVYRHPGSHALQVFKHHRAVHRQVA